MSSFTHIAIAAAFRPVVAMDDAGIAFRAAHAVKREEQPGNPTRGSP